MSVFDNKDGFRPRDYSSSTRAKYQTEADHWIKAFKSAQINSRTTSFGEAFSFLSLLFSFTFSLLSLIVVSISDFINWVKSTPSSRAKKEDKTMNRIMGKWKRDMNTLKNKGVNQ